VKEVAALRTRVDVLSHFITMKFPEFFAGEAQTVVDPDLKPVQIIPHTLKPDFVSPAEASGERERANERKE
jgi:hypothetical protein